MQNIKVPLNVKTEVPLNGDTTNFRIHTNKKALDKYNYTFCCSDLGKV